jgi:hypothetical protein
MKTSSTNRIVSLTLLLVVVLAACTPVATATPLLPTSTVAAEVLPTNTTLPTPTLSATSTPTFTPLPPTPTALPTATPIPPTPVPTIAPVALTEWILGYILERTSDCPVVGNVCWIGITEGLGAHNMRMIGKQEVYVDPQWPSPYLVFWHEYKIGTDLYAEVRINTDSARNVARVYQQGTQLWVQEALDLQAYKGQTITVEFYAKDGKRKPGFKNYVRIPGAGLNITYDGKVTAWTIQDVRIVPDFVPAPAPAGTSSPTPAP